MTKKQAKKAAKKLEEKIAAAAEQNSDAAKRNSESRARGELNLDTLPRGVVEKKSIKRFVPEIDDTMTVTFFEARFGGETRRFKNAEQAHGWKQEKKTQWETAHRGQVERKRLRLSVIAEFRRLDYSFGMAASHLPEKIKQEMVGALGCLAVTILSIDRDGQLTGYDPEKNEGNLLADARKACEPRPKIFGSF